MVQAQTVLLPCAMISILSFNSARVRHPASCPIGRIWGRKVSAGTRATTLMLHASLARIEALLYYDYGASLDVYNYFPR